MEIGTSAWGHCFSYGGTALAGPVTSERLLNAGSDAEAGNWLMVHRTYDNNRFSPLTEINAENVMGLKMAFSIPLGGLVGGLEPSAFAAGQKLFDRAGTGRTGADGQSRNANDHSQPIEDHFNRYGGL